MYHWYLVHPEYRTELDRALQGRAEAQSRAAYLAIVAIEGAVVFIVRTAVARLRGAGRALTLRRRRRKTVQALSRLDARMLRDVGIYPGDIERIAASLTHGPSLPPLPAKEPAAASATTTAPPPLRLDLDCPQMRFAA